MIMNQRCHEAEASTAREREEKTHLSRPGRKAFDFSKNEITQSQLSFRDAFAPRFSTARSHRRLWIRTLILSSDTNTQTKSQKAQKNFDSSPDIDSAVESADGDR